MTGNILNTVARIVNGAPEVEATAPYCYLRSGASTPNAARAWMTEWTADDGDLTWKRHAGEQERRRAAEWWLWLRFRFRTDRAARERLGESGGRGSRE
jgi:hypothetical protein